MKKIAQIGDLHLDEQFPNVTDVNTRKNWERVLMDIITQDCDEVICTGDMSEAGALEWFFNSLSQSGITHKVILGNHDNLSEVSKYYNNKENAGQDKLYYTEEDDFYKYIFLDSSPNLVDDIQFDWFKNQLITTKQIIVFIHHPILGCGLIVDEKYPLHGRQKLSKALHDTGKHITIFCGHYHMSDERTKGKIKQYITPAVCFQIEKLTNEIKLNTDLFGYRVIEIANSKITTEVKLFNNSN